MKSFFCFFFFNFILGVVRRGVRRGSPWTGSYVGSPRTRSVLGVRGPVFSGHPLLTVFKPNLKWKLKEMLIIKCCSH